MWAQLLGTSVGGLLVIVTNFLLGRQQHAHERRKIDLELRERLRAEKLGLIRDFWSAARVLEGWAASAQDQGFPFPVEEEPWNRFWNTHVSLDLLLDDEAARSALREFGDRLRRSVRNDNGTEPVWSYLQSARDDLREAFRGELRIRVP